MYKPFLFILIASIFSQVCIAQNSAKTDSTSKAQTSLIDDDNRIFTKAEISAEFPGGTGLWQEYLKNNISNEVPAKNGAPAGVYNVIVRFVVGRDSILKDFVAETKFDYGMEYEVIKVLKHSPKWSPAIQNGYRVSSIMRQPVTFVVTDKISNDTIVLKKGFYKNYKEYLNNAPSILINFSTKLFAANREKPIIVQGEYTVIDTTDMFGDFWGFCDGKNIFIPQGGFFEAKYWKLQSKGPNPYFFYKHSKSVVIPFMPLASIIISSAIPSSLLEGYELMFIDNQGIVQNYSKYNLKQLLKDNEPLFNEFKKERFPTEDLAIKYILRYNEAKLRK